MPELPEIELYLHALGERIVGAPLEKVRLTSISLLRTWDPPVRALEGLRVVGLRRVGKRIVWVMEEELFAVFHLMVTGRFHLKKKGAPVPRKTAHAAFDFPEFTLLLTEMSRKKKASLHVVRGEEALAALDPGGLEPLEATPGAWRTALRRENRTLKRALTDPRILSGIGNAHSDEILLEAGLSPVQRTGNLDDDALERLREVTVANLRRWSALLREETGDAFPEKITAFHPAMGAHGRYGKPCPRCGGAIQRIVYAENETNYCPACQTGGKLLADRALSRLLGEDWPRTPEELEELRRPPE